MVYSTWGSRCDKVVFVTDKEEENMEFPMIEINITGSQNLWGKTKVAVKRIFNDPLYEFDWILKVRLL